MRLVLLVLCLSACDRWVVPIDAGVAHDAGAIDAGFDAGSTCAPGEVELRVVRDGQHASRVYALVEVASQPVALLVDTASQITFLSVAPGGPDPQPNAGTIDFGCDTRAVAGRAITSDESIEGRPVVGFLGNDFFFEQVHEIDLGAQRIRSVSDRGHEAWPSLQYENLFDYIFVRAKLDGEDVRLGFDTGAPHALWLARDARPGDVRVDSNDALGNPVVLWLGTAELELDVPPARTIPILRTLSFPSIEESNRALGGNIHGLLGLSGFPSERVRIDATARRIYFAP
jgi:hypothetical protein